MVPHMVADWAAEVGMLFEVGRRYQRPADILLTAYYDAVAMGVRRSNCHECPLSDRESDLGNGPSE